jgi:group I intron endonuclease
MKLNVKDKGKSGIYCIRNNKTGKVYIGKAKSIYDRISSHNSGLNKKDLERDNEYFIRAYHKYGDSSFEYFVLEYLPLDENLIAERELYWIKTFDSTNSLKGYNLRTDSDSRMIVHEKTSKKISKRLKKEWKSGIRKDHGQKLSENWKNNPNRKIQQSKILSNIKTKYVYLLYDLNNILLETCNYEKLKELKLQNSLTTFCKKNSNIIKFKSYIIERQIIKDIV